MMKRNDLLTNEEFIPTRNNQKFACPENRIKFHNNKANELRQQTAFINKPLHKNYKILLELMDGHYNKEFHKQFLLGKGFEFGVFTHLKKVVEDNHIAIYDFTVVPLNDFRVKIIVND